MSTIDIPGRLATDDAVADTLAAHAGFPVGYAPPDTPEVDGDGLLVKPYAVLYLLVGVPGVADWGVCRRQVTLQYQATVVGRNRRHAQAAADRLRTIWLTRTANGTFAYPLGPADTRIIDRQIGEIGAATEAAPGLWQVQDTYTLEVTRA